MGGFTLSDEDGHSYLLFPKDPLAEVVYLKTVDGELNIKLALNNL